MNPDETPAFLYRLSGVFSQRVRQYGATPAGVLWKDRDGQRLRFEVLAGILDDTPGTAAITIGDLGCGYGAFFDFLAALPQMPQFEYFGYDISSDMIALARERIGDSRATFQVTDRPLRTTDFIFVSGTYNLHIDVEHRRWTDFVKTSLAQLWPGAGKGLAFNMLAKHHRKRLDGLYYADSQEFLEYCARFSSDITLIEDYPLDEWTIFIRRSPT